MKRYDNRYKYNRGKIKEKASKAEHKAGGFRCSHCKQWVVINEYMGTANRNHCNLCLWSKHVDERKGDRLANCQAGMRPIGLTFKHEGYGRIGEIMLIHRCSACPKTSINRIAGDDIEDSILEVFTESLAREDVAAYQPTDPNILLLGKVDSGELHAQLYGNNP